MKSLGILPAQRELKSFSIFLLKFSQLGSIYDPEVVRLVPPGCLKESI